jgi:hypothetical protein
MAAVIEADGAFFHAAFHEENIPRADDITRFDMPDYEAVSFIITLLYDILSDQLIVFRSAAVI